MIEIYIGEYFFQAQPLAAPNSETVVKMGTPVCWYNVGLAQHTATGGPWDSGALNRTDSYIWVPDRIGVFPYTCRFHGTQMIAHDQPGTQYPKPVQYRFSSVPAAAA